MSSLFHPFIQIALFIICTAVLFLAFKTTRYSLNKISIPTLFFLWYFIWVCVGFPLIFFGLTLYKGYSSQSEQTILYQMFFAAFLGLLFIIFGIAFVNIKKKELVPQVDSTFHKYQYLFAVGLFAVSVYVTILYFKSLAQVPFFALLSGAGTSQLSTLRSDAASSYEGKVYYYTMFTHGLLPFLSYYFFASCLLHKKRLMGTIWILSFLATALALLSTLHKAPIVFYCLILFALWAIVRQREIRWRIALLSLSCAFGLVVLLYFSILGFYRNFEDIFLGAVNRVFTGQIVESYYYFKMFPDKVGYLLGQSLGIPSFISPFDKHYQITVEIYNYAHPARIATGVVGRSTTPYWAEIYANFGFFAIPLFSFLMGIYMGMVQRGLEKKITPLNVALFLFFTTIFLNTGLGRFTQIMPFSPKLLLVLTAGIIMYFLRNFKPFKVPLTNDGPSPCLSK